MDTSIVRKSDEPLPTGSVAAAQPSPQYVVRLFGTFAVTAPDGSNAAPAGRKARALLAYLLLAGDDGASRDRIAALLWSERGEDQARASLRQTLHELRTLSVGDAPLLSLERSRLGVVADRARTDVDRLRALEQSPDAGLAATLVGDQPRELLMDFGGLDPAFDEWLAVERVQRRDERRRILLAVATSVWTAGDAAGAHRLATCLLAADPYDEAAARISMQASQARGDRDGVRLTYGRLETALRRDVHAAPSDETRLLHQRLMAAAPSVVVASLPKLPTEASLATNEAASHRPAAVPADSGRGLAPAVTSRHVWAAALVLVAGGAALAWQHHAADAPGRRVMSVQPLQVAVSDSAAQALRVGLSADLARVMVGADATLDVVDATRPERTADTPAAYVVTGEAGTSDGVLHANIQLRGQRDRDILWSNSFERPANEVDALREQMAAKLADVSVCAIGGRNPALDELGTETMRLYLSGCEHKHGDWPLSAKLMKQVTERKPGFAHAWAMLAAGTAVSALLVPDSVAEPMRRDALGYAQRALALDPHDGEAYFAQAEALPGLHNWQRRRQLLETGRSVEPNNGQVMSELARDMSLVGRWHEAIDDTSRAVDADPFSPGKIAQLGLMLAEGDAVSRAHDVLEAASKRFPKHKWITKASFLVDAYAGDIDRAARVLDDPQPGFRLNAGVQPWKVFLQARRDPSPANVDAAVRAVTASQKLKGQGAFDILVKLTVLGRVDQAYARALALDASQVDHDDVDMLFWQATAPLRADPRFMTLATRFGLVAIWQQTDRWPDFCSDHSVAYDCRTEARRAAATLALR